MGSLAVARTSPSRVTATEQAARAVSMARMIMARSCRPDDPLRIHLHWPGLKPVALAGAGGAQAVLDAEQGAVAAAEDPVGLARQVAVRQGRQGPSGVRALVDIAQHPARLPHHKTAEHRLARPEVEALSPRLRDFS